MQVTSYLMSHHQKNLLWEGPVLSFLVPGGTLLPLCDVPLLPVHSCGQGEQANQYEKECNTNLCALIQYPTLLCKHFCRHGGL